MKKGFGKKWGKTTKHTNKTKIVTFWLVLVNIREVNYEVCNICMIGVSLCVLFFLCLCRCSVEILTSTKSLCPSVFSLFFSSFPCISAWLVFDSMSPCRQSFKNTAPLVSGSPLLVLLRVAQLCKCIDLWAHCGWVDFPECLVWSQFSMGTSLFWQSTLKGGRWFFFPNKIPSGCTSQNFLAH